MHTHKYICTRTHTHSHTRLHSSAQQQQIQAQQQQQRQLKQSVRKKADSQGPAQQRLLDSRGVPHTAGAVCSLLVCVRACVYV